VSDDQIASATVSEDATGKMSLRQSGRYMAAFFNVSGRFKNFSGFDANVVTRGAR
jgi:hypothetical protein